MSLIPTNVFDDAHVLHSTYQKLTKLTQVKTGKDNAKQRGRNQSRSREANRALRQLDRNLLEKLTPELFRQLVVLEWSDSPQTATEKAVVSRHVWRMAGSSITQAKRLAHLIVHATMLYCPPSDEEHKVVDERDEADLCYDFLLMSMGGMEHPFESRLLIPSPFPLRLMFGFIAQLIHSANRGDQTAHDYLRLFYRSLGVWGFDLQPVAAAEYSVNHQRQLLKSVQAGLEERPSGRPPLPFPLRCPDPYYSCLVKIIEEERTWIFAEPEWSAREGFWKRLASIPLTAYDGFLEAMWSFIDEQKAPSLVLAGGHDKVVMHIPYYQYCGIVSFAFVREHPAGGFRCYPEIGINLFIKEFHERAVRQLVLDREGKIKGFKDVDWAPHLAAALWCIIVDAYAEIVLPADAKENLRNLHRNRSLLLKPHHANGESVRVRPHFAKLPPGWKASQRQIEEAILQTGSPPQEGYTFKGEHHRGFPGTALPYQEAMNAWEVHERIEPSLVVTQDHVGALLTHISDFV